MLYHYINFVIKKNNWISYSDNNSLSSFHRSSCRRCLSLLCIHGHHPLRMLLPGLLMYLGQFLIILSHGLQFSLQIRNFFLIRRTTLFTITITSYFFLMAECCYAFVYRFEIGF